MTPLEIPVCALCRCDLGVGMTVTVWPPSTYDRFLATVDRPASGETTPIVTCRPCGLRITDSLTRAEVQ